MALPPPTHRVVLRLAIVAALCVIPSAWAENTARLRYVLDPEIPGCPPEESLRGAVVRQLRYDPFREDAPREIFVEVKREKRGLRARMELRDPTGKVLGERLLTAGRAECLALATSAALAISIAIDPLVAIRAPPVPVLVPEAPWLAPPMVEAPVEEEEKPFSVFAATRTPPIERPEATATVSQSLRSTSPRGPFGPWAVAVGATGAFEQLPHVTPGLTLLGEGRWGRLSLGLEGSFLPSSVLEAEDGTVETRLLAGSALVCVNDSYFAACAVGSGGGLFYAGRGFDNPRQGATPYVAAGLRIQGDLPLDVPGWALRFQAELMAPVIRTNLALGAFGVWQAPTLNSRLGVAVLKHL